MTESNLKKTDLAVNKTKLMVSKIFFDIQNEIKMPYEEDKLQGIEEFYEHERDQEKVNP